MEGSSGGKIKEKGEVWVAYTCRITRHKDYLKEQVNSTPENFFSLYLYHSKQGGGRGQVTDVAHVDRFVTGYVPIETPDPSSTPEGDVDRNIFRTWLHACQLQAIQPPIEVLNPASNPFRNYETNAAFGPSQVVNAFAYITDVGDDPMSQAPSDVSVETSQEQSLYGEATDEDTLSIIAPEEIVESLIAFNPNLLELGDLRLIGQQVVTSNGRMDLLFEDENNGVVVVGCKKGRLSDSDIIQLKDYLNWTVKEYPNRKLKGILVCHNISPRQANAIEMDRMHGYDLEVRTYECLFRIKR